MRALARVWQKPRSLAFDVAPVALYLALLFWAGLIPLTHLPGPDFTLADKVWHAVAFGGLALLGARALRHFFPSNALANRGAALAAAALGALLEVLQSFTSYRSADFADFVADSIGAALAYYLLSRLARAALS